MRTSTACKQKPILMGKQKWINFTTRNLTTQALTRVLDAAFLRLNANLETCKLFWCYEELGM